jgi:SP family arabinose:H+ symporter-like MFS transporter
VARATRRRGDSGHLFLILLFGIPRSPRWSVSKDRIDEACRAEADGRPRPRGGTGGHQAGAPKRATPWPTSRSFQWKYRYPLFLAITIGAFNQLAGINAILYYLNNIFASAGFTQMSGDLQAIAIGATNLVFTLIGMTLIDRLGRKTLLLIGAAGCAAAWAAWPTSFSPTRTRPRCSGCWSSISPSLRFRRAR